MKKLLGIAGAAMVALSAGAAEYYVDSAAGDDAAAGTSPQTAWRSLEKVNAAELRPGDVVRFKRGGLWRGSLAPRSGEPGNPVTYTSYGTGPKPILQQSVDRSRPEDWFEMKPGFWSTRIASPKLHEAVWTPSAGDECGPSFQEGMKGTLRKMSEEGGAPFWRVTCTGEGARRGPHLIQIWGPKMKDFPGTVLLKMQVRASKPFPLKGVRLMQNRFPWTGSHAGGLLRRDQLVGADWREVSVLLTEIKGSKLTGEPRFHLAIGDVLPVGGAFDFRLLGAWRAEEDANVSIPADVGIFICDHGARWGVKKWRNPDWDVPKTPKWEKSVRMENDLDFCYDPDDMRVVVKFPRNPGEAFKSIELAMTRHVVNENGRHDVVYDGLWVRYGAAHGFGGGSTRNITIRNCDISWIGGGLQFWRRDEKTGKVLYPVRFGNGIEFWGNCRGNLVERNRLWEVYDAALTNQGRNDDETDVTWRDNVIWNSEYSFEYWNAKVTRNIRFEHNTCVDAGSGWAHAQRPDPNGAHLMYYSNRAATTNFVVRDNIFCRATEWTCRSALDWRYGLLHSRNLVWNEGDVPTMRWKEGKNLRLYAWPDYVKELQMDLDSVFAEPQFVDSAKRDYRLKPGSPGSALASDGGPVGARNMPGLDGDQSAP